jgi:hypothetical protein
MPELRSMNDVTGRLRQLLLLLVVGGAGGLLVELVLLKHYDGAWQVAPLVLLLAALATGVAAWVRPAPAVLKVFGVTMGLCVAGGLLGLILHYRGNMDWALERDSTLTGLPLAWKALRGATPALAPGALAQLGLLGLIYLYRHPALTRGNHTTPEIA